LNIRRPRSGECPLKGEPKAIRSRFGREIKAVKTGRRSPLLGKRNRRRYTMPRRGRGGTGRRAGLKIRFRKECRFDSDRPHQGVFAPDSEWTHPRRRSAKSEPINGEAVIRTSNSQFAIRKSRRLASTDSEFPPFRMTHVGAGLGIDSSSSWLGNVAMAASAAIEKPGGIVMQGSALLVIIS
jgi:hypothetical protein